MTDHIFAKLAMTALQIFDQQNANIKMDVPVSLENSEFVTSEKTGSIERNTVLLSCRALSFQLDWKSTSQAIIYSYIQGNSSTVSKLLNTLNLN